MLLAFTEDQDVGGDVGACGPLESSLREAHGSEHVGLIVDRLAR